MHTAKYVLYALAYLEGVNVFNPSPIEFFGIVCLYKNTVQALLLCPLDPKFCTENVKNCTRTPISYFASASGGRIWDFVPRPLVRFPFRKFLIHHL